MLGRVTVYVDSEVITSFQGDLEQWRRRDEFRVPRSKLIQTEIGKLPEPQLTPLKTITLKLQAQLLGDIIGEPYICLFFYNYDNPTQKQMSLDVAMAHGQMRKIL